MTWDGWDASPASVWRAFWRWFWVGAGVLALLAGLILGGWRAGWWFTTQNTAREAHNIRNGYSNQQSLRDQITAKLADVSTITVQIASTKDAGIISALRAQRAAVAGIVCQDASEVTGDPLPAGQQAWAAGNCQAGSLRPGTPYYQAGTP